MEKLNEVTVFTNGDSGKISTWSNIPYFLTETLLSKGIRVNRVDISPSKTLNILFQIFLKIIRIFFRETTYEYYRSFFHFVDVRGIIRKAIKEFKDSQANIFLTFSFSSFGLTSQPTIQLCDWTYDYYFKYFLERHPDILEKTSIRREDRQIEGSDLVLTLYPGVAKYMNTIYKNNNIMYIGNVINSNKIVNQSHVIELKITSKNLLFIGNIKYKDGAQFLIDSFKVLKNWFPDLVLNIVGMNKTDFDVLPDDVHCFGYLDKDSENDRRLYYSLLENARIFVNTTPKWGAFSATLEAMYFFTPIIVTPYNEFIETFGSNIEFGLYCEENNSGLLTAGISRMLTCQNYNTLCVKAHESVKDFTWSNYIEKMLRTIEEKL